MWPKCGLSAAQMWPEYEILWPVINPWTFPVALARPVPKPQARSPAQPSPIKKPISSAECDQIPKMDQIICFYVNTHVLKSEAGDFVILKHCYCIVTRIKLLCNKSV